MTVQELLALIFQVLKSRDVIIVTIVIALYVNIVTWIVRYRKRPAGSPRKSRRTAPAPQSEEKTEEGSEDDEE